MVLNVIVCFPWRGFIYLQASKNLDTDTLTLSNTFLLSILNANEIICFMHGEHTNSHHFKGYGTAKFEKLYHAHGSSAAGNNVKL